MIFLAYCLGIGVFRQRGKNEEWVRTLYNMKYSTVDSQLTSSTNEQQQQQQQATTNNNTANLVVLMFWG
jgi:hypothetical protein